jgi:aminoglycoside/choline kinase family phosphotransferase
MEILNKLYAQRFGAPPASVHALQGELGGSGRRIFRLSSSSQSSIGILHGVREENAAFLGFSRQFRAAGLPVPEIYAESLDDGAYLEQDLGDTTLYQFLQANRDGEQSCHRRAAALSGGGRALHRLFAVLAARQL